ncbi:cupin domain-containing protein [Shewanella eurypsychrophilus]|uniref:Cupin domain-containing protein n=1 Tax=Shewanella eurypsychrophilus TaxID=2593656 RepID=A0ABX6V7N7_9GAMM|nr:MULTISPECIES: cupin domain-containing protein [Shewanella]QFU23131.1 cupin domain-containing protein [Shewanella sp. YLB-09]QPG58414.1 cupin domain-containing protein [Shewanella eurypsychrophilus]
MYTLNLNTNEFLAKHWQQTPVVIKNAFTNFVDPISADELAGLACEEEVSSRIIITKEKDWDIIQGPIHSYDAYGEDNWQLLVQAVNHWFEDSVPLVEAFRFIPDWRFDDLMVSFATPGGGVGPHIDNYDVFLLQGEGTRRWKVGDKGNYAPRGGDTHTALIDDFEPIIDVILEKGDMLYIPPGYPHRGETITTALSYSIGFRSPSQQELMSSLADHLLDTNTGTKRFISHNEPEIAACLSKEHQVGLVELISSLIKQPKHYQQMLGQMLSQSRFELDLCEPEQSLSLEDLKQAIEEGAEIARIGGLKIIMLEEDSESRLFVNGEVFDIDADEQDLAHIASQFTLSQDTVTTCINHHALGELVLKFLNKGYYYLA